MKNFDPKEYRLFTIKPGKRPIWDAWCAEVREKHLTEGAESLREEDLVLEWCATFGEGDQSYVLYRHVSVDGEKKKPANPRRELNQTHFKKFWECLDLVSRGEEGYFIEV